MFNQTDLKLKPSISAAIILATPCIASLVLILSLEIPTLITLVVCGIILLVSFQIISQYALLNSSRSINSLTIYNHQLYLQDVSGTRYLARPTQKNIIHPLISILSFECEPQRSQTEMNSDDSQSSSKIEVINIRSTTPSFHQSLLTFKKAICKTLKKSVLNNNRRHLFICRYNTSHSSAYRRLRVWLKYSQEIG